MKPASSFLLASMFLLHSALIAQYVPNGGFEDWEIQENLVVDKENPKGWTSRNHLADNPQALFCYRTDESYAESSAVVLQNFYPSPGLCLSSFLSLGVFDPQFPERRGIAFTHRPTSMSFAYKYFTHVPNPTDFYQARALVQLTKWDATSKSARIVGEGEYFVSERANFYQVANVPIEYFLDETPDTLRIIFTTPGNPEDEVRFTIDNVYLEMHPVSTDVEDKLYLDQVSLFPNPVVGDWLSFFNPLNFDDAELLVFDALGTLHVNQALEGTDGQINCQDLTAGMYFYQIRQANGLVKTGKLVKEEQ